MKILLVNPYIYDFTAYDLWLRPLGLLYIASVLKKYTDSQLFWIDTLDRFQPGSLANTTKKMTKEDGRGKFYREIVAKPSIYKDVPRNYARYGMPVSLFSEKLDQIPEVDLIIITSLMTYWVDGLTFTISQLKKRFPRSKLVLGGIIPTLIKNNLKGLLNIDRFIAGYGEKLILDVVRENGGKVYSCPDLNKIENIPYPAFEHLSSRAYLPLLTARGCPYNCTYCASGKLNKVFLQRSPESVLNEIYFMHENYGTEHFIIFDDALLVNKEKRFHKIFSQVSKDIKVRFHTPNGIHAREIDTKTADTLYKSGFKNLRLSFESTDSEILNKSANKVNPDEMVQAVKNLRNAGFMTSDMGCYILFGMYKQNLANLEKSLRFTQELGIIPHLAYFSPVPGTEDFFVLQRQGILSDPVNLYQTNKIYFSYQKSGFKIEDINRIKKIVADITQKIRS